MKILVTGGGGFLGQALCPGLRERGFEVVSFNRGLYPALDTLGVQQVQGDLAQRDAVIAAATGCDAVIHNAAKAGAWGSYESYHLANVVGTDNVIAACGLPVQNVLSTLSVLEMRRLIRRLGGNRVMRNF